MINKISISDLNNKNKLVNAINALIEGQEKVDKMSVSGNLKMTKTPNSIHLSSYFQKGGTSASATVGGDILWLKVIEGLSYPSPDYPEGTESYAGRSYYNLRDPNTAASTVWSSSSVVYYQSLQEGHPQSYVSVSGVNYRCILNHTSDANKAPDPEETNTWWEKVEDITVSKCYGSLLATPKDLRNCIPWYSVNEIIPVTKYGDDYFILNVFYTGEPDTASLRYLEDEGYVAAVFA